MIQKSYLGWERCSYFDIGSVAVCFFILSNMIMTDRGLSDATMDMCRDFVSSIRSGELNVDAVIEMTANVTATVASWRVIMSFTAVFHITHGPSHSTTLSAFRQ